MQKKESHEENEIGQKDAATQKKTTQKEKNLEAVKKYREKKKGALANSLLDQAKDALISPHFNVELVLDLEQFKTLSESEKKKLRDSAKEKRRYHKNQQEKTQKIQSTMAEEIKNDGMKIGGKIPTPVQKLQSYIEIYTDRLDQAESYENRLNLLRYWNREEHLSLVHHFSQLNMIPGNFQELLKALCEVINDDQNLEQQLRIFVCICSLYKKPVDLPVSPSLYTHMLSYLVEQPAIKSEQATGFLKAAFCNGVSLVGSDIKSLREFDLRFSGHIDPFYTKLQISLQLNQRPFLVLPQTCFFLSKPVINLLKASTESTAFLPIEYYHYFLSILVYTFSDEQALADQYLVILKDSFRHWERIKNSNYDNFLSKFLLQLQDQDPRWYGKLDIVNKLMSDTLALATQKKITDFNPELVNEIMIDEAIVQDLFQRVSTLEQNNQNEQLAFLQKAIEFNHFNKKATKLLETISWDAVFDKYYQSIFKEWGLSTLNPQQLALCKLAVKENFLIVNPGLGMGKSTFIAFQSIHQACDAKGSVIVILNSDEILLYRDYSKVNFIVQQLQQKYMGFNFSVELIDASVHIKPTTQSQILFMQPSLFLQCQFTGQFSVLIDECHRDLFANGAASLVEKLKLSTSLFATTGTTLTQGQLLFLQQKFHGTAIRFEDIYKHNCQHVVHNISTNSASHINIMIRILKQECQKAPVVVILNEQLKDTLLAKTIKIGKSSIVPLFGPKISKVQANERIMSDFIKQNEAGQWNCYLIDEQQGTGTDFPSHPDIEMNGGVRVVIAVQPASYAELCQFQRRTARLNNKGYVLYVINRSQTQFRGATKDYLASVTRELKAQADLDIKKALRQINNALSKDDSILDELDSNNEENDVDIDNQVVEHNIYEEEKQENQTIDDYADRDMCSFCFGEIRLGGIAHVCNSNGLNNDQQQMVPDAGKETVRRIIVKEDKVNQDKETPRYSNPLLQELAEKPKVKKFGQNNKQSSLGFQPSGKRSTRKYEHTDSEQGSKKRQKIE